MSTAVITPIRPALSSRSAAMRPTPVAPSRQSGSQTQSRPATKMRLTRRGRVVFTSLAAAPLVGIAAWLGVNALPAVANSTSSTVVFEYETIESGQSLWQLAATVAPESDPRDVIADIMRLNQLDTSTVSPGQRIAIPEQYAN
ncbi:LysM peptidoglycan-binding domain-containing protein [Mycetocola manganoxydans]|uniref:LysM peptidoglycan-binding domain-containing protein n=1 Tax=Mycetocola manganoxydans TaxID=699879 RepID=A0A3L6ZPL1_9MICO|nr:LysM peptidoglycan-binding domain-containing protein [Mycetocola manganoxydans]RLP69850.1 LysM peptidoglycan-binding domain-containing protein [Mycetocola manganoxydans]